MTFSHELTPQILKYQLKDSVVQIPTYAGRAAEQIREIRKIKFKPFVRTAAVATDFAADRWGG